MRIRLGRVGRLARVGAATALVLVVMTAGFPSAASAGGLETTWRMNSPNPRADSSGNGHPLWVGPGVTFRGGAGAYDFTAGAGLITATPPPPYGRDFSVTVETVLWGLGDRNIVQQGRYSPAGTQWKLEIQGSRLVCSFKGSSSPVGGVRASSPIGFARTGTRYVITCTKTSDRLQLRVNGRVIATTRARIGSITTPMPVSIGGKLWCEVRCDHFVGRIFRVRISQA